MPIVFVMKPIVRTQYGCSTRGKQNVALEMLDAGSLTDPPRHTSNYTARENEDPWLTIIVGEDEVN